MKLKSYFSATVEAAMDLARKELGEDALLVNARPATPETRYLGAYEVVFGVVPAPLVPPAPAMPSPAATPTGGDQFRAELADLRRQIERLSLSTPDKPAQPTQPISQPPLQAGGLSPAILEQLAQGSRLDQLFRTDPQLGRPGAARAVVALVGPPGVGKTTALIKLAARYGVLSRRPAQILTTDVNRIAAAGQLQALAAILGIACEIAETPLVLAQQLEEHHAKDLVLIDTPGFSFREMDDATELAALLASHPEIDTHLVLSASMKRSDMSRVVDRYMVFRPSKLIFTRVDETASYGALVSEASRRSLPISFLSTGQQIPDDIEEATVRRLTDLVLGDGSSDRGLQPLLRKGAAA
jgi:flagellar biosynthesis protein FlhF